jgi:LysM repeat protein
MKAPWIALGAVLFASSAPAQVLHRIERGDTLAGLAERYYGDSRFAEVIASHNGLERDPQPGTELRVPSASHHDVQRGESWSDLAARYWSDAQLGEDLARWCERSESVERAAPSRALADPPVGARLLMPALVTYRIHPGETLAGVSRRFYAGPERAAALARLNRIEDPRYLRSGQSIRVPLLEIAQGVPEPPAEPPRDVAAAPAPPPAPERSEALAKAVNDFLDGSFEAALAQLEEQRARVLASGPDPDRALLLRYLTYSYVAFDRPDAACESFGALAKIERPPQLDPDLVSPRIRDVLSRCDPEH